MSINVEASKDIIGIHAKKTPVSDDVVCFIPIVSKIKYTHGQKKATKRSGFILLFLKSIFIMPKITRIVIKIEASKNLQPRRANALANLVASFVKR